MMQPRHWAGLFYGAWMGALYALLSQTVNALTFPDLPMEVNGLNLLGTVSVWMVGLGILGLLTAWPASHWRGVVWGALMLATFVLSFNLIQSASRPEAQALVLLFTLAPVLVMCLPATGFLRWLAHRQMHLLPARRWQWQVGLIALAAVVGLTPGALARMSPRAESAVRAMHRLLQTGADPQGELFQTFPNWPLLRAHVNQPYTLSQTASQFSAEGVDVRVRYGDGYGLLCVWVTISGRAPYLRSCAQQGGP